MIETIVIAVLFGAMFGVGCVVLVWWIRVGRHVHAHVLNAIKPSGGDAWGESGAVDREPNIGTQ